MKRALIFILLCFALSNVLGQPCYNFHKDLGCSISDIEGYKLYGQSKSAMVEAGKTYKYQVVLFGGYDYKIGLCTETQYKPIHFRIINKIDNSVYFDNLEDNYIEIVGFSNEKTKNVIFEFTLLATELTSKDIGDNRACIGIAIYWQKTPKLGF